MNITSAVLCSLFIFLYVINADPEVRVQVYEPHGLRIRLTVPQPNDIKFVHFSGFAIHHDDRERRAIGLSAFGFRSKDGDWIYEHSTWNAYVNDPIYCDVFMSNYERGFRNTTPLPQLNGNESSYYIFPGRNIHKNFVVTEILKDFKSEKDCVPSATILRNGVACSGQTIFEDNFDFLDSDLWQIEHYIPRDHPEQPFVSYQRLESNPTVYVDGGKLYIQPRLQHTLTDFNNDVESLISGTLDLSDGCTRRPCVQHAVGDVLPPVASGRVTSANFAFTYGIVTIRAKLPQGDWLYPEILLEPFANKYGSKNYASGVIKMAMALGNEDSNLKNFNNKWLSGWLILNEKCHFRMRRNDAKNWRNIFWGADFHNYTLKWTPEGIEFGVDGQTYGNYTISKKGFRKWLPSGCMSHLRKVSSSAGRLALFDEHFFITLGMAAGGMAEFPDRLTSNDKPKPWRNGSRKAILNFLQDMDTWFPTWNNSALIIDSIKVVAL